LVKILAIDQSLNETGYYLFDGNHHEADVILPQTKDKILRLLNIRESIRRLLKKHIPEIVVMEDYSYGSKGRATFSMGELGGLLKLDLILGDRKLYIVPIGTWKKYVAGKGNLKKEQILLQVYKKYGIEFKNNNICDAFCLGKFIQGYLQWQNIGPDNFLKYELEVFKNYEKFIKEKQQYSQNIH